MGLKAGEKVRPLATIRVVSVRPEPLSAMTADLDYGFVECEKEGFGGHPTLSDPGQFVEFFCGSHRASVPPAHIKTISSSKHSEPPEERYTDVRRRVLAGAYGYGAEEVKRYRLAPAHYMVAVIRPRPFMIAPWVDASRQRAPQGRKSDISN